MEEFWQILAAALMMASYREMDRRTSFKRPALGFSACLVLETARKAGHLPLGTFDRDLAKLVGAVRLQ